LLHYFFHKPVIHRFKCHAEVDKSTKQFFPKCLIKRCLSMLYKHYKHSWKRFFLGGGFLKRAWFVKLKTFHLRKMLTMHIIVDVNIFPKLSCFNFISFVLYIDNMIPTLQLSVWCGISTFLALHFWSCIRKVEILIRKVEINTYPFCTWKIEIVLVFRFFAFSSLLICTTK
jgi:hypothetical protein